ncbi:MAG: phosphoglycerate dehydrogenase [SAR324 cluster bacterium]|nr:phosphoglycerate dehydrogenase [SAR324 cluster bacterium]
MKRVLVTNLIMLRDLDEFRPELKAAGIEPVPHPVKQFLTEDEMLAMIPGFDGAIAGDDQYTARVLEAAAPSLKVISKWGTGLDTIDLQAAQRLGIKVFNSPGAFSDAVADVALGYMLMLTRRLHLIDRAVRAGQWPKIEGQALRGKMLGVIGYGAIGRGITARAGAFGMEILANDVRMEEMAAEPGIRFAGLADLLARSDFVCLCCNLTPENHGLIDATALARMKPSGYLINVARGALVDEHALLSAISGGRLAGAALDVYQQEPLPAGHALTRSDHIILGSHNANNAASANEYVNRNTIRNLLRGFGLA